MKCIVLVFFLCSHLFSWIVILLFCLGLNSYRQMAMKSGFGDPFQSGTLISHLLHMTTSCIPKVNKPSTSPPLQQRHQIVIHIGYVQPWDPKGNHEEVTGNSATAKMLNKGRS